MLEGMGVWLNNLMVYFIFEFKGNLMDVYFGWYKFLGDCLIIILKDGKLWVVLGFFGGYIII